MTQLHGNILPYKGKMPKIADDVFVAPGAQIIGDVEIGAGSSVWFNCVLRGDDNPIRIGERVNVQDGTVIHVHSKFQGTYIGNDITIGHMALLHACNIQDKAFVGMGSIVLDRCTIETHGMLAGGAMLTPGQDGQIRGVVGGAARQVHAGAVGRRNRQFRLVVRVLFGTGRRIPRRIRRAGSRARDGRGVG